MKIFTTLFVLLSFTITTFAQTKGLDSIIFAFPDYTRGTVTLKDGSQVKTVLNYNYHNQNVLYKDAATGQELKLDNLKDIALIEVGKKYFIPVLTGLGELVVYDNICLVYSKKISIEAKKEGAYGTAASTSSISNVSGLEGTGAAGGSRYGKGATSVGGGTSNSSVSGANYSAAINDKSFGSQTKIKTDERFFLCPLGETKVIPLTKKNLLKSFPSATAFINSYFDKNNPDLENLEQAKILVTLCNEHAK
ncbi:MAG: hypothetical protein LBF01_00340 [Bacteroidales bacterium]|jgi:hypothetical protein|nr:hypothetical protein [Bacteroidales bacterium]